MTLRKGDRVRHIDYGACTVVKIDKDGAVWVRVDDNGITGTTTIGSLRKL